ncbi:MAG: hypothetical protein ACP5N7_01510 [Candidatus Pacearchaeota archaeon]
MVGVVQILLANTAIFFVVLIVLLFVSGRKKHKVKDKKQYLSKELLDIKEQISEDLD